MELLLIILIIIVFLIIIFFVGKMVFTAVVHNKLLKLKNKVENASAHIDVQLKRRFDLIPNLVEVVKGASYHEQQIIKSLSLLFEQYAQVNGSSERLLINEELSRLLNIFYKEVENNPNVRANANFLLLQKELSEIEEDISFARQFYNDAVTIYNNAIMSFPNNIVAKKYRFEKEQLFDVTRDTSKVTQIRIVPKQPNEIKCVTCGAILEDGVRHCKYCGTTF